MVMPQGLSHPFGTKHSTSRETVIAERLKIALRRRPSGRRSSTFSGRPPGGRSWERREASKIVIEDRGDNSLAALQEVGQNTVDEANATPGLAGVFTSFRADTPWLYLDIDRTEAKSMGVSMAEVFNTLQVYFGSLYVNDFNRFGRTWQVNVQADAKFRMKTEDLQRLKIPNAQKRLVPLAAFASVREISGPVMLNRYNLYPAALINAAMPVLHEFWGLPSTSWSASLRRVWLPRCAPNGRNWPSCN